MDDTRFGRGIRLVVDPAIVKAAHFLSSVVAVLGVGLTFGASGAGCKCERDKPYVPYSIDDRPDAALKAGVAWGRGSSLDAADAQADAAPLALAITRATAASRTLVVEGMSLVAPPGQTFVGGASYDWDGDGAKDAAVVLKADVSSAAASLYSLAVYRGGKEQTPSVLAASPPLAPCGREREADPERALPLVMTRRGKSSLVIEVGSTCPHRSPSRWLVIVATEGKSPRARFSVGIADPPGAHPLIVDADAVERDGDGIDDVVLRASLEGAAAPFEPGPKVTAALVWLDRTAGLSRDPAEPEASFRAFTGSLSGRATRAKEAALVPVAVRQLRHLAHAVCAEGGSARLVQLAGATLPACAGSKALEEAGLAEARSHATLGDALRASLAFDRAQRPPSTKTPARIKETQAAIEKLAPVLQASSVRTLAVVPDEPTRDVPSYGPLAFEGDGRLLIKTRAGVVRADPVHGDEADAGRPPWSLAIGGDGRPVFAMALSACDGVAIRALFNRGDASSGAGAGAGAGVSAGELLLPIVPPLSERCVVPRGEPAAVLPLAWGPSGLEAVVSGEPVLIASDATKASLLASPLDAAGHPGSAKSPDGQTVVVPTSLGLVVRSARARTAAQDSGARLLRAKELDGAYGELRHCAVSNDARRVACLRAKRVIAGIWEN